MLTRSNGMATLQSILHFLYPRLWIMKRLGASGGSWPYDVSLTCEEGFPILHPVGRHCPRVSWRRGRMTSHIPSLAWPPVGVERNACGKNSCSYRSAQLRPYPQG